MIVSCLSFGRALLLAFRRQRGRLCPYQGIQSAEEARFGSKGSFGITASAELHLSSASFQDPKRHQQLQIFLARLKKDATGSSDPALRVTGQMGRVFGNVSQRRTFAKLRLCCLYLRFHFALFVLILQK